MEEKLKAIEIKLVKPLVGISHIGENIRVIVIPKNSVILFNVEEASKNEVDIREMSKVLNGIGEIVQDYIKSELGDGRNV